jgi:hypothetical protein
MNERQLEQILTARFHAEADEAAAAPTALYASVAGIPGSLSYPAPRFGSRRSLFLLAAATVLLAATVGGALAMGSGLIRPPWIPDGLIPIGGACAPTLADGVVLEFRHDRPTVGIPPVEVYEDGVVLRRQLSGWEQRRLTEDGVKHLVEDIEASTPLNCDTIYLPEGDDFGDTVIVRRANGIGQLQLGPGYLRPALSTPESQAAARSIVGRFVDPDLSLPPSDWVDAEWGSYIAERYVVEVGIFQGWQEMAGWDVTLPDGSTLRTFGESQASGAELADSRCGVVSGDEAQGILTALNLGPLTQFSSSILRIGGADRPGDSGYLIIQAILPHERGADLGCSAAPDSPQPVPGVNPALVGVDPCLVVPYNSLLDEVPYDDNGWLRCEYLTYLGGEVYLRNRPTTANEALELVKRMFGEGFTQTQVGERSVYFNECLRSPVPCTPAIAIADDPYFMVLVPFAATEAQAQVLASAVIANLP